MSDREFSSQVAEALATAVDARHAVRCETEGCGWAVHTGSPRASRAAYEEHLRTDPRHTGGEWIDRDGRTRRGLEILDQERGEKP